MLKFCSKYIRIFSLFMLFLYIDRNSQMITSPVYLTCNVFSEGIRHWNFSPVNSVSNFHPRSLINHMNIYEKVILKVIYNMSIKKPGFYWKDYFILWDSVHTYGLTIFSSIFKGYFKISCFSNNIFLITYYRNHNKL